MAVKSVLTKVFEFPTPVNDCCRTVHLTSLVSKREDSDARYKNRHDEYRWNGEMFVSPYQYQEQSRLHICYWNK